MTAGAHARARGHRRGPAAVLVLFWGLSASPGRAAFNELVTGARPQGMGGAFVAVADDVNALYWNPAGLSLTRAGEVGLFHTDAFTLESGGDITHDFVGISTGPIPFGSWGVSFFRQSLEDVLEEKSLSLSYGVALTDHTRVGLNMKTLALTTTPQGRARPDPAFADQTAFTFDIGFMQLLSPDVRLGFLARNLGGKLGVVETEALTRNYRLGLAVDLGGYFLKHDSLVLALDLATREDIDDEAGTKVITHAGIEYAPTRNVAFRAGVDDGKLSAGLSFSAFSFQVDYGYSEEEVGNTQVVSFSYRFESHLHKVETHHHVGSP